ncbi:MAG: hydroxysqualene dehydroxylase HpnE [Betaproteobacteria bacterium]|nr:FAD-dependent oxidoreductase [Rhodocyclaceae bacterium]MCA3133639.1 FAD-dependent oxidoreductase [Rhodocyclaceae bacterium]MCA3142960.1 FAD-dependent oxidoreductase [Rhodocyclaceae bacterium]MCA3144067.1 FAD-dependent oxidoreductase [Rhodocyclaceae bacterium]
MAETRTPPGVSTARVRVIGAGWAGLAAAVTLARHGVSVAVHEAASAPGGRARRVLLDGVGVDNGLHILLGAYESTLQLLHTVSPGLAGLQRLPLRLEVAGRLSLRSAAAPPPFDLLIGLLRAEGLTASQRLATVGFMLRLRLARFRALPGETVAGLLDRFGQLGAARTWLWEPLCIAALNTAPAEADAQVFLNVVRDGMANGGRASDLLLPASDLGNLFPEPACRWLEARGCGVHLADPVRAIRVRGSGFTLECRSGNHGASQVICATDPTRAAGLVEELPALGALAQRLRGLRHLPITSVYLQYEPERTLPAPMLGLPDGPLQWAFDRGALCGQHGLLACVASAASHFDSWGRDRIAAAAHAQLSVLLPDLEPPRWQSVISERRATFACVPGIDRPAPRTALPGLLLAGDYTASDYPATLEAAVRSGIACAHAILESS